LGAGRGDCSQVHHDDPAADPAPIPAFVPLAASRQPIATPEHVAFAFIRPLGPGIHARTIEAITRFSSISATACPKSCWCVAMRAATYACSVPGYVRTLSAPQCRHQPTAAQLQPSSLSHGARTEIAAPLLAPLMRPEPTTTAYVGCCAPVPSAGTMSSSNRVVHQGYRVVCGHPAWFATPPEPSCRRGVSPASLARRA